MTGSGFPAAAHEWLAGEPGRLLAVGSASAAIAARLETVGCRVTLVEKDAAAVARLQRRHPGFTVICAASEALPFHPASFDLTLVAQGLHLIAPGLALAEFARVLAPGGRLALSYTTRDDSVPWVRRLAALLQAHDPELMSGRQIESVSALDGCAYFPDLEDRSFRMWVPISRDSMLEMVSREPRLAALAEPDASALLEAVGAVYDGAAREPEPLLLPYAVQCWRAEVCHDEFTSQLRPSDGGLRITL